MRRKLTVMVSALLLATQLGGPLVAAVPTTDELAEIAGYLENNDVEALRAFLLLHPELLDGDTQLSRLLSEFMNASEDMAGFLGLEPDLRDALLAPTPEVGIDPPDTPDMIY